MGGGGRRGGAGEAGGETGISQIDEKILFEVRWSDKCGRKHCGSGVSVGKISSGGKKWESGWGEGRWPWWAPTLCRHQPPQMYAQHRVTVICMRI